MAVWLQEFGMQILLWLLGLVDSVFSIFSAVSGIAPIQAPSADNNGTTSMSLGTYFMSLDGVHKAFVVVFIASIGVCAVCTITAIVKNIVASGKGQAKTHARTVGQALGSVIVSLVMAVILTLGVTAVDGLLCTVNTAINGNDPMTMSREIINISVSDISYEIDIDDVLGLNRLDEDGNNEYVSYLFNYMTTNGKPLIGTDGKRNYDDLPKAEWYDGTTVAQLVGADGNVLAMDDVIEKYKNSKGEVVKDDNGVPIYVIKDASKLVKVKRDGGGWLRGKTKDDINADIWSVKVKDLLGDAQSGFVFPSGWKCNGYFDPDSFNFLVAYLCTIIVTIALVSALLGLVKRLFDIVLLFIVLPGISATIPLDDGAKFKLWRETVISKLFLAYGSVFAVTVFYIVAPSLWGVTIAGGSSILNTVLRMVLICGGALTISGGQVLFARLLGTSAEENREMMSAVGGLARTGRAVAGVGGFAGRALFGKKNKDGEREGGLIKGGANVFADTALEGFKSFGNFFGGQRFANSSVAKRVNDVQDSLRNFGSSKGWFKGSDNDTNNATTDALSAVDVAAATSLMGDGDSSKFDAVPNEPSSAIYGSPNGGEKNGENAGANTFDFNPSTMTSQGGGGFGGSSVQAPSFSADSFPDVGFKG